MWPKIQFLSNFVNGKKRGGLGVLKKCLYLGGYSKYHLWLRDCQVFYGVTNLVFAPGYEVLGEGLK